MEKEIAKYQHTIGTIADVFVMLLERESPFHEIQKFTQSLPIQEALELAALIYYGRECINDSPEYDYSSFIDECSDDPRDWMRHAIDTKSYEALINYIKLGVKHYVKQDEII